MDIKFLNFNQLRSKAIESPNKVAFMVECFKVLHSDAPPEDLDSKLLGGRLASILTQANKDYCRVLQVMWKTSADGIAGSHLSWIQKILINSKDRNVKRTEPTRLARVAVKELADKDKGNGK
jgi:hypothetical protein